MTGAPEFTGNRDGNMMAEALARVLGGSLGCIAEGPAERPADPRVISK